MSSPASDEALIAHLRSLPEASRAQSLADACAFDVSLRSRLPEISRLLASDSSEERSAHANAAPPPTPSPSKSPLPFSFNLFSPASAASALEGALDAADKETSGTRIGPYKLLQEIGQGGFGVVWMAEQQEPLRRTVALKIVKIGMDTREVIARFEVERQALALMDHPNIAHVFDAGATATGRPYFVMELVRGIAITRYCDENQLPTEARLQLFAAVCQAVQHAHQKGVIHRDLKPSNILVTLHDGKPVPKVIDFGIAKATSARLTEKTLFTQFHAFVGTPAYTSPEQMEMSGLNVDTRSDIYSLGVLLYELLTGRPPFDPETLLRSGLEAMRRTVREVDPVRPSQRLSTLSDAERSSVAHQRGTEPPKLSLLLRGDLDWIVMRCLEKDRTRRYDTAASLAADVGRHLHDERVLARPPARWYLLQKFTRRHRVAVFATVAVAASLLIGLVGTSVSLLRERHAHARAVVAEKKEAELRRQAEIARNDEVRRAARTALELANRNLAAGDFVDGVAYLAYAARKDPYNPTLAPRLASALASHNYILPEGIPFPCGSPVVALRYSLDGASFFAGTEDGTLRVFSTESGKLLREFRTGKTVLSIGGWVFPHNNDGIAIARSTENSLTVFDTQTGRQQGATIVLDPSVVPSCERIGASADGRWLCAMGWNTTWVWHTATGSLKLEYTTGTGVAQDFDFSADGQWLGLAGGDEVRLWSLPDFTPAFQPFPRELPSVDTTKAHSLYLRFLADSRRLLLCDPFVGARFLDFKTGSAFGPPVPMLDGFSRNAWEIAPDGRLLHIGNSSQLVHLDSGEKTPLPLKNTNAFREKHFSRDGTRLLTISPDESARLWDTSQGQPPAHFSMQFPQGIRGALHPSGARLAIGTADGFIHWLQVGRGGARPVILPRTIAGTDGALPAMFLPQTPSRLIEFLSDRARIWDVASGRQIDGFPLPHTLVDRAPGEGSLRSPLRADGKFLIVRRGNTDEAWELSARGVEKIVALPPTTDRLVSVAFSPVGDWVAATEKASLYVANLRTGKLAGPRIETRRPLWYMAVNFSPDGRRIGMPFTDAPVVWDVSTCLPAPGTFMPGPDRAIIAAQFSPDGTRLLVAERQDGARLWDVATGTPLTPPLEHPDTMSAVAFSPDGRFFATRGYSVLRLWNSNTLAPVGEPISLPNGRHMGFSADSRRLLTVSEDGKLRIYDAHNAQAIVEPMDHGKNTRLPSAFFSPDGHFVRTETTANDFRIWSVPPSLPSDTRTPEWLIELATLCVGKSVNDDGVLSPVVDSTGKLTALKAQLATLPADAPLVAWGRWILDDREDRPIAPGFSITYTEADRLADRQSSLPSLTREH